VFTDESRFCKRSDGHYVWRRRGQRNAMSVFQPTDKFTSISAHGPMRKTPRGLRSFHWHGVREGWTESLRNPTNAIGKN
jgi:hypothetical protein